MAILLITVQTISPTRHCFSHSLRNVQTYFQRLKNPPKHDTLILDCTRGIGPLPRFYKKIRARSTVFKIKTDRAELNFAPKNSPLVAVFETRWLVVSD